MKVRFLLALAPLVLVAGFCAGCATTESQIAPEPAPASQGQMHRGSAGEDAPLTGGALFNGN
jgi:hypothetical protein